MAHAELVIGLHEANALALKAKSSLPVHTEKMTHYCCQSFCSIMFVEDEYELRHCCKPKNTETRARLQMVEGHVIDVDVDQ